MWAPLIVTAVNEVGVQTEDGRETKFPFDSTDLADDEQERHDVTLANVPGVTEDKCADSTGDTAEASA